MSSTSSVGSPLRVLRAAPALDSAAGRSVGSTVAMALAVSLAYYLGAHFGFALKLPSLTTSLLWPPNTILTAALLIAPPRRWWIYLVAGLPAHLLLELHVGWSLPLVIALFATNCSQAVCGAYAVRVLSDAPARFDTLGRVSGFILGAVLFGPFVSSFLDAAVVTGFRGEPYWLVWRTRFFSNALTELALAPVLVKAVMDGPRWIRTASRRRRFEAALLVVGLVGLGSFTFIGDEFVGPGGSDAALALLVPILPAFLLAFSLLAAVYFGAAGASLSLLAISAIAVSAATHGRGLFINLPPTQTVLALQVFVTALGIPLLCLGATIEERRRSNQALAEQLRFEALLSRMSTMFVHPPGGHIDQAITSCLRRLGEALDVDRITVSGFSEDEQSLFTLHSWVAAGRPDAAPTRDRNDFPWSFGRLITEQDIVVVNAVDFPPEAQRDKESFLRTGIKSHLVFPLVTVDRVVGALWFSGLAAERIWPEALIPQLRLVAEVLGSALARKQMEDALRASETLNSAILASLANQVAVVDRDGRIVAVNDEWARLSREGVAPEIWGGVGGNYLHVWRLAARHGGPEVSEALRGIEEVLDGSRLSFAREHTSRTVAPDRWFAMSVVPLKRPEGGAVVSHTEITERKRAEIEAQHSRQELAHFARVSTMGELSASLAHELNQPLTGILANAQAAQRFMSAARPDLNELRDILSDIIDDGRRAGDVIQRLRHLLRKGEVQPTWLDLNALIHDVVKLLSSDALIRDVSASLELDPATPIVTADGVQLQQVIMNLLLNAMEAIADSVGGDRTVRIRTSGGPATVHVSVQDDGPGLRRGTEELVFEPFYTTKPSGMGMGLCIARSIIGSHGGTIWATNNTGRGATFHFSLPLAGRRSDLPGQVRSAR